MMKKLALFVVALGALPAITQTALFAATELSYRPRNAKGTYPFVSYLGGVGQINLVNGNLVYGRQLVSRPGRGGLNLDLSIYYNSKIWDRDSTGTMYVKDTGSWVGLGWYLGFPRLVVGQYSYVVIFPDGSSHELLPNGGAWKSVDSTYILLDVPTKTARLKGGLKLIFGNTVGHTSYMTEMKDTNGNRITATYVAGTGKLNEIYDTLGLAARFYYSADGYLERILSLGKVKTSIYFHYVGADLSPVFSAPVQLPQVEQALQQITVKLPTKDLSHIYTQNKYGELIKMTAEVKEYCQGTGCPKFSESYLATYDYTTYSFYDPALGTSVEERVVSNKAEYAPGQRYDFYFTYTVDGSKTNPSATTVIDIRGTSAYVFRYSTAPARSWSDGLVSSVQRTTSTGSVLRTETTAWTQDDTSLTYMLNPRATSTLLTAAIQAPMAKRPCSGDFSERCLTCMCAIRMKSRHGPSVWKQGPSCMRGRQV